MINGFISDVDTLCSMLAFDECVAFCKVIFFCRSRGSDLLMEDFQTTTILLPIKFL
jgi:hypothetical protein